VVDTGEVFAAVCVPSLVLEPVTFSLTAPVAAVTALTPAAGVGVPVESTAPMSASESAAETKPVLIPAPINVASTEIATELPESVIAPGNASGSGVAVPVIGTTNVENVPVTPRHPFD
jgi:hypothetical protein